jgi:hypothetical protein
LSEQKHVENLTHKKKEKKWIKWRKIVGKISIHPNSKSIKSILY